MKIAGADDGRILKAFLRERRARIAPESVGLPAVGRRLQPGLRREDVAELLDVTPLWYSLFESGTSGRRFSAAFIRRVADLLELDAGEQEYLMRLVTASGNAARDCDGEPPSGRWLTFVAELAEMSRKLSSAKDDKAATGLAFEGLRALFASARPAFTLRRLRGHALEAVYYDGPSDPAEVIGQTIPCGLPAIGEVVRRGNRSVIVPDLRSDNPIARAFSEALAGSCSYARCAMVIPVATGDGLSGVLRVDSPLPNAFSKAEADIADIIGVQLGHALRPPFETLAFS